MENLNEKKQIEEMAKVISNIPPIEFPFGSRLQGRRIYTSTKIAEHLYNENYRKQSENTIELPCKVGTTLYFLYNSPYADKPDLVPRIYQTTDWYFEIDKTGIAINTRYIHSFNKKYDYYLGETAFLTKREAEQALVKMKGGAK